MSVHLCYLETVFLIFVETGRSDIPLTARGEEEITSRADVLVGEGSETHTYSMNELPSSVHQNPSIPRIYALFLYLLGYELTEHSICCSLMSRRLTTSSRKKPGSGTMERSSCSLIVMLGLMTFYRRL